MNLQDFQSKDIGQFIMTGISGDVLTDSEKKFIQEKKIGGVILFSHNYKTPIQLAELANTIQSVGGDTPLFIGVDQEGGRVQRFKDPFKRIPPMLEIGLMQLPHFCYKLHRIIATELRSVGVNLSFAPVCDVLTNQHNSVIGDRAFSSGPYEVARYVATAIEGLKRWWRYFRCQTFSRAWRYPRGFPF